MRCAIYTRKSADEAADTRFGSIEAQRELCEKYIASQAGEGWQLLPERYDDGGYSGGNLNRPSLKRLVSQIEQRAVDIVVVYKIDRLSRSLRDFVGLVEMFDRCGVTFVAITQSFSTTTSMGRLTLNVLLSFAQFEREVTGERLRDWFAGARARGMWVHGKAPFGYRVVNRYLQIEEADAECVRYAFRTYPRIGSARLLANDLNRRGWLNKYGRPWSKRTVAEMLQNPIYCGNLRHKGDVLPGIHEPIVSQRIWEAVQRALKESATRRRAQRLPPVPALLRDLIRDANDHPMIHVFVHRNNGKIYRYYVPSVKRYGIGTCSLHRFRAEQLEAAVIAAIDRLSGHPTQYTDIHAAAGAVRRIVSKINVRQNYMTIAFVTGAVIDVPHDGQMKIEVRPRRPPPWLADAIERVEKGMSWNSTAKTLDIPTGSFFRIMHRWYDRKPRPAAR